MKSYLCLVRSLLAMLALSMNFLATTNALAATLGAASCAQPAVQSAINSAIDGDTVIIPSGNCTWTAPVTITDECARVTTGRTVTFNKTADTVIVDGNQQTRTQSRGGANCPSR